MSRNKYKKNDINYINKFYTLSQVYWFVSASDAILPKDWSPSFSARFGVYKPMKVSFPTGEIGFLFIGVSL